jgi:hypothetical protein
MKLSKPSLCLTVLVLSACGSAGDGAASSGSAKAETSAKPKSSASASAKPATSATASAAASASAAPVEVPLPTGPLPPVEIKPGTPLKIGGKEISAEVCKLDASVPMMRHDSFDRAIRGVASAKDGVVYVLDNESKLRKYTASKAGECELTIDKGFGQGGVLTLDADPKQADYFDTLAIDGKGDVYVSGFIAKAKKISGGQVTDLCKDSGRLVIDAKSGNATKGTNKIDLADCKATPVKLDLGKDVSSYELFPLEANVAAVFQQKAEKKNVFKVGLFADTKQKWVVGEAEGDGSMCNVGTVAACGLGVCVVDANCRALKVVDAGGKLVGSGKINDLLGLSYPWPRALSVGPDATFMAVSHSPKDSKDKHSYALVYRIKGLN